MVFGGRLKALREKRGWTQQELADRLNISRNTVAGYESKGKIPREDTLVSIANLFDTSTDYLLGRIDDLSTNGKEQLTTDLKKVLQTEKAHWGGYPIPEEEKKTIQRVLEAMIRREEEESATKES